MNLGFCRAASPLLLLLLAVCNCSGGHRTRLAFSSEPQEATVPAKVTVCELVRNPELYSGKEVTVEATYARGFEWSDLFSDECPNHRIWLEGRGLDDVSEQELKRAYNQDPLAVYIKLQGAFVTGGPYVHRGGFPYEIVAHKVFAVLRIDFETHILSDSEGLDWTTWRSISTSLKNNWIANMPESVHKGQQGKNSLRFSVLRDGSVPRDSVKLVTPSDTSELDEASVRAVYAAAPFDRLPEQFSQPSILLCTVFYYNARRMYAKEESPFFKALFASVVEMDKAYAQIDDSMGGSRVRTDYHHLLIEKDPDITHDLPEQFGGYHFEYLDTPQLISRYKKLRKEFSVLKIQSSEITGSPLKILVYWVSYKKGKLDLGLSDWSEVGIQYDCEKQSFAVSKVRLGGI